MTDIENVWFYRKELLNAEKKIKLLESNLAIAVEALKSIKDAVYPPEGVVVFGHVADYWFADVAKDALKKIQDS